MIESIFSLMLLITILSIFNLIAWRSLLSQFSSAFKWVLCDTSNQYTIDNLGRISKLDFKESMALILLPEIILDWDVGICTKMDTWNENKQKEISKWTNNLQRCSKSKKWGSMPTTSKYIFSFERNSPTHWCLPAMVSISEGGCKRLEQRNLEPHKVLVWLRMPIRDFVECPSFVTISSLIIE